MNDFVYYAPTKVFFGRSAESNIGAALKEYNTEKALIVYGGGSAKRSGLLDKVEANVKAAGIPYIVRGGVEPNPKIGLVRELTAICREEKVDFILAVGGGSVLDTCKAVGMALKYDGDPWDMFLKGWMPESRIPIGAVVTISAAGSEMSHSCVISNPDTNMKCSLNGPVNRPQFAFMNPENTFSVSPYQTACGIVDIMMHTLERYFTCDDEVLPTDYFAEGLLRTAHDAGVRVMADPEDYEARAAIMWASSLSHNDITGCGRNFWFINHKLEHAISGIYDSVAHGAGLAVVFPAWAKYEYKNDVKRFARYAENVWGIKDGTDEEKALAGIETVKEFFREIGMPVTMAELGITPDAYGAIADNATSNGTKVLKSYTDLTRDKVVEIYELA